MVSLSRLLLVLNGNLYCFVFRFVVLFLASLVMLPPERTRRPATGELVSVNIDLYLSLNAFNIPDNPRALYKSKIKDSLRLENDFNSRDWVRFINLNI